MLTGKFPQVLVKLYTVSRLDLWIFYCLRIKALAKNEAKNDMMDELYHQNTIITKAVAMRKSMIGVIIHQLLKIGFTRPIRG